MINRLLHVFKRKPPALSDGNPPSTPFSDIYELLFCDRPELFEPRNPARATPWQRALYGEANPEIVRGIATDPNQESRIRLLAYRWLNARGYAPTSKEILGVIIEVGLETGNDTLAAFADGSVRYINQSGKLAIFEGVPPEVAAHAKSLVATSRITVNKIGPWKHPRRPPPGKGVIRLSFLVADGLYFGEGPFDLLANEPLARSVVQEGLKLLQLCIETATAKV